ncbi:MAG: LexA family protein [Synechococcus sp.]
MDLNDYLIDSPAATNHIQVRGDSMIDEGIVDGDILVVNRSLEAIHRGSVVEIIDGEPTVKRLHLELLNIQLRPENTDYPTIHISEEQDLQISGGGVTGVVRKL